MSDDLWKPGHPGAGWVGEETQPFDTEADILASTQHALETPEMPADGGWHRGDWMQTFTGIRFYPLDPRVEDIDPRDIAHALSMICRYGGHIDPFYCPTPEQRVLTADLVWKPAGDLKVGDELLGFDEHATEPGQAGKPRRRFRHSTVLHAVPVKREIVRLVMSDGSEVRASAEHPWLLRIKTSGNQRWAPAGDIARDLAIGRRRYINRFMPTWETATSYADGWLAGIFDGEGHISFRNRTGVQFGVAQNPGLVLEEVERQLARLGFSYTSHAVGQSKVRSLDLHGGWRELTRLLGTTRPVRLVDKFQAGLRAGALDKQFNSLGEPLEIVAAEFQGVDWVSGLETSSRTFLQEGFGAHNSVAEHCVLMASVMPTPALALEALLHDASEAYVGDMVRPLKHSGAMGDYKTVEMAVEVAIAERFGHLMIDITVGRPWSVSKSPEVQDADTRILLTERTRLMPNYKPSDRWTMDGMEPLAVTIAAWDPATAEAKWMERFEELIGSAPWGMSASSDARPDGAS